MAVRVAGGMYAWLPAVRLTYSGFDQREAMPVDLEDLRERVEMLTSRVDQLREISDLSELRREYLRWYTEAQLLISRHVPSMFHEFENLYYSTSTGESAADAWEYHGIRSYMRSTSDWGDKHRIFRNRFNADIEHQRGILLALPAVIELRALEVEALVTADLVSGEIDEARLLLDHGFGRAAGAVAGVALESHLKLLHNQSSLEYDDKDTIVPLATRLRKAGLISLGDEKKCIAMSDTRNNCDHKNEVEPTQEEIVELINDADRFAKRVQVA